MLSTLEVCLVPLGQKLTQLIYFYTNTDIAKFSNTYVQYLYKQPKMNLHSISKCDVYFSQ